MTGLGLSLVAAVAILAACYTDNGARALTFVILAFFAILGAMS